MVEHTHMVIDTPALVFEDSAGNKYTQQAYRSACSVSLIPASNKNYGNVLSFLPQGTRISNLDEVEYLLRAEDTLKTAGKSPREALKHPLFARQIQGNPYLLMHSNVALCAPERKSVIPVEPYKKGRVGTVDYKVGDRIVARDVRVPVSGGGKIVAMNRVLRGIPIDVSNGNEPQHTMHWHFDPEHYDEKREVAVRLGGDCYHVGRGRCLDLLADVGRSYEYSYASFRLFQGSLDETPLPQVEHAKIREGHIETQDEIKQKTEQAARELSDFFQQLKA